MRGLRKRSIAACLALLLLTGGSAMGETRQKRFIEPASERNSETQTEPGWTGETETEAELSRRSFAQAGMTDGTYELEAELIGGTGKTAFAGPLQIAVQDGEGTLRFALDSEYYDYVKVDDVRYEPLSNEGQSLFEVPLPGIGGTFAFIGDTTRMSEPHEVAYTVFLDAEAVKSVSKEPSSEESTE